jgi:CheY-like chemotaxis protein
VADDKPMIRFAKHGAVDFRDLHVLVVEDEPYARELSSHLLRSFGCLVVREAKNGEQAIDMLTGASRSYGLVMCDFRMPGMTGLQLLKRIRTGLPGVARDTAFAMLTGHADKPIVGLAFQLDVDCYLTKPIAAEAMRSRVTRVMMTDRAIKSPYDYQDIDVDGVMETDSEPGERASPGIVLSAKRNGRAKAGGAKAEGAAPAAEPGKGAGGRSVPLKRVAPGSVLAEPVITGRGQLLVPSGVVLDMRTLERLRDLAELDPSVRDVVIE